MEKQYWTGRKRSAMAMAHNAVTSQARLIHYELAGRYSIMAAQSVPFGRADDALAEARRPRATLHLAVPGGSGAGGGS